METVYPKTKLTTRKPPLVKGFPILGNTYELATDTLEFLIDSYKKYGSVFRIKTLYDEIVVMAGLEANQFLSRHANDVLKSEDVWRPFSMEVNAEKSLVSLDGKEHGKLRKIMMRGYSPHVLMGKEQQTIDITKKILEEAISKPRVGVVNYFKHAVVELLGNLTTGINPGKEITPHLIYYLRVLLNVHVVKMWPKIMLKDPKFIKAKKVVQEFSDTVWDSHKDRDHSAEPDLIDDLMLAFKEGELNLNKDELRFAIVGPFFAGIDTVANNCSNILWALIDNPDVLERVRAEVDPHFTSGEPIDMKSLRTWEVMLNTVLETLRRYNVAPVVHRTAAKDFEFGGCLIEEGQDIYMAQGVAHFMEDIYPDPYKFDIDRYTKGREEHKKKAAHSPYGLGAHKCLGMRLNEVATILIMGYVAHYCDFELSPPNYKLKISALPTPGPDENFKVRFKKREV